MKNKKDVCPWLAQECDSCNHYRVNKATTKRECFYISDEEKKQNELMGKTGFKLGDICLYSFDDCDNNTALIVRINKFLSEQSASVDILIVIIDDSGNGIYKYLKRKSMSANVSLCYLKKVEADALNFFLNK